MSIRSTHYTCVGNGNGMLQSEILCDAPGLHIPLFEPLEGLCRELNRLPVGASGASRRVPSLLGLEQGKTQKPDPSKVQQGISWER
jgi:hypothetical protein